MYTPSTPSPSKVRSPPFKARRFRVLRCRITVVTDVVREEQSNLSIDKAFGERERRGTKMGVGSPEYVLLFQETSQRNSKLPTLTSQCSTRSRMSSAVMLL